MATDRLDDLLRQVVVSGDDASFEKLVQVGPEVVERFRACLAGEHRVEAPSDRNAMDNTMTLSCRLARQFPDEFVTAFNSRRWIDSSFVLAGLSWTGRSEVTPILIEALGSDAPGATRLSAAKSLASFPGPESVRALMEALDDSEYLIQYHAINSLGQIGDAVSLDRLLAIAANPPSRGIALVAPRAAKNLAERLGLRVEVPEPDMSRWPPLTG